VLADAVPLTALARALVIKLRHHGDVLLAAPVFSVLKARAPGLEIDALVYDDTAPMLETHPAIARLYRVERAWRRLGLAARAVAEVRLYRALRARRYDLLVHLTGHPRGAWLARVLGVRWSVAPALPGKGGFWRRSFTHLYAQPAHARRHRVEVDLDALRRIGIQPEPAERRLVFCPSAAARARIDALLAGQGMAGHPFVHLHPASRWAFKCWPARSNARLIDALAARGLHTVLTAAPEAREIAFVAEIAASASSAPLNWAGQLSIEELAALSARARLFIGVDSMPMHLAAAMGTPVVALFGPSGEHEWRPWQVPHRVVASERHPCRPCGLDGCGGGKVSDCLVQLELDPVLAAAEALLAETEAR